MAGGSLFLYNASMLWGLGAILLYAFSIPVIMKYRILPVEGTPYWLFGTLFLLLTGNVMLSLGLARQLGPNCRERLKNFFLLATLTIVLGGTTVTAIVDRAKTAPVYGVHDIILQQEAAIRYLLQGKNPYKETYFGTPLEAFNYDESGNTEAVNPALYHFVMPPWYLLFPLGIYAFTIPTLGYFDGRMALFMAMAGTLLLLWNWFKKHDIARLSLILTALSPATVDFFIEGRSDTFVLFWLVWALVLLERKRFAWSAFLLGLAFMSKQTAWFAAPLILAFVYAVYRRSIKSTFWYAIISAAVAGLLAAPFLLWDAKAFVESTVTYLSGSGSSNYPISGYGLGMLLYSLGIIKDIHDYYPFAIWQIALGLPTLAILIRWIMDKPLMSRLIVSYALFLSIIWYLSRYFNNSHLGYLSSLFVMGVLKNWDESGHL